MLTRKIEIRGKKINYFKRYKNTIQINLEKNIIKFEVKFLKIQVI